MNNEAAILATLEALDGRVARMDKRIADLDKRQQLEGRETLVAVTSLTVKAGIWGAVSGLIPAVVLSIIVYYATRAMAEAAAAASVVSK